jgi:bis(5'-nucleosyl)-tetraphosphatase (symmetrical)
MTLAIGDVQGCDASLEALLIQADPESQQSLWLTGDLVNRGHASLATLRRVRRLGQRAVTVLGNHDLHLLAVATGVRAAHRSDTIGEVLTAPDLDEWIDWLRNRPLAHCRGQTLLVHAGLWPQWSADEAMGCAAEVEHVLRGPDWVDFLRVMYGNVPDRWDDALSGDDRLRAIVNALTRMRFVDAGGRMDFAVKEGAAAAPAGLMPWFDAPGRRTAGLTVVFGHWSTLGLLLRPDLVSLDTGCVWGGSLTAVRLEDRAVFQVRCRRASDPAAHGSPRAPA